MTKRTLNQIARDIQLDWSPIYYAASPYVKAMVHLDTVDDYYGYEGGREIVIKFLGNAGTWRGSKAREIKKELKTLLK